MRILAPPTHCCRNGPLNQHPLADTRWFPRSRRRLPLAGYPNLIEVVVSRPGAAVGDSCSKAALHRTEFSKPVVQPAKSVSCHVRLLSRVLISMIITTKSDCSKTHRIAKRPASIQAWSSFGVQPQARPPKCPHASTFAMKAFCIPTRWRALLLFPIPLNHVYRTIAFQRQPNNTVEPSCRNLPSLELAIPLRLGSSITSKPFQIPLEKRNSQQHKKRSATLEYRRNLPLAPDCLQLCIGQILRHK